MTTLLEAADSVAEAERALQELGMPLEFERREVEAFLRLRDDGAADPALERLLLVGAALRLQLSQLRDHLETGGFGAAEVEAAVALELSEHVLGALRRRIDALQAQGPSAESARLRFLRIRLMRDYSALWLEIRGTS